MLTHWLGSVNPPNTGTPDGTLSFFDQNLHAPGGNAPALSMDNSGLLYTPPPAPAARHASSSSPCTAALAGSTCWATSSPNWPISIPTPTPITW